jgi:hypothetical protein
MPDANPIADRREQILGELAEDLALVARETKRRLMEAEDNDAFVRLSGSLCKVARGVRQCVAMHARLESDRRRQDAEAESDAGFRRLGEVHDRRTRIAKVVGRRLGAAWYERDDTSDEAWNAAQDTLNERLDDLSEDEDFLALDPDALIAQLCEEFGVEPPQARDPGPTSPAAAAAGGGGPLAAEGAVERTSHTHRANGHTPPAADSS